MVTALFWAVVMAPCLCLFYLSACVKVNLRPLILRAPCVFLRVSRRCLLPTMCQVF